MIDLKFRWWMRRNGYYKKIKNYPIEEMQMVNYQEHHPLNMRGLIEEHGDNCDRCSRIKEDESVRLRMKRLFPEQVYLTNTDTVKSTIKFPKGMTPDMLVSGTSGNFMIPPYEVRKVMEPEPMTQGDFDTKYISADVLPIIKRVVDSCPACGTKVNVGSVFCTECGVNV